MIHGAKGSKGAKRAQVSGPTATGQGGSGGVARGTFSIEAPPVAAAKGGSGARPRSSSFKMSDAKSLSRALAKGEELGGLAAR